MDGYYDRDLANLSRDDHVLHSCQTTIFISLIPGGAMSRLINVLTMQVNTHLQHLLTSLNRHNHLLSTSTLLSPPSWWVTPMWYIFSTALATRAWTFAVSLGVFSCLFQAHAQTVETLISAVKPQPRPFLYNKLFIAPSLWR